MEGFVYFLLGCGLLAWIVGWLLACGVHARNVALINNYGSFEDRLVVNRVKTLSYVLLILFWPIYLKRISE